mmetsp:Transcript_19491/g.30946  ORF Transcript_19491/g.30946 Transcript_19491/m.30946 type:complete len:229 (+) Transcript_19491:635-1321(+)
MDSDDKLHVLSPDSAMFSSFALAAVAVCFCGACNSSSSSMDTSSRKSSAAGTLYFCAICLYNDLNPCTLPPYFCTTLSTLLSLFGLYLRYNLVISSRYNDVYFAKISGFIVDTAAAAADGGFDDDATTGMGGKLAIRVRIMGEDAVMSQSASLTMILKYPTLSLLLNSIKMGAAGYVGALVSMSSNATVLHTSTAISHRLPLLRSWSYLTLMSLSGSTQRCLRCASIP